MRLSTRALTIVAGLFLGFSILVVGLINLAAPEYGTRFLQMTSSVYPWFRDAHSFWSVIWGTISGFVEGGIIGFVFAVVYNFFAGSGAKEFQNAQSQRTVTAHPHTA